MKRILLAFVLITSLMTMVVSEVHARRFGGRSFGRQSSNVSKMQPAQRQQQAATPGQQQQAGANKPSQQPAGGAARQPSRWGGMLGGALLGLGLGALLSHLGIGGQLAGMISTALMIMIIFFAGRMIFRMMTKKREPEPAYQQAGAASNQYDFSGGYGNTPQIGSGLPQTSAQPQPSAFQTPQSAPAPLVAEANQSFTWSVPADIDVPSFIRDAKTYFIRLQAAWDKADINDIREFTTPQMFAEMRMQITERGAGSNVTDVVALDAELLGIETIGDEYFASVRFTGTVREDGSPDLTAFDEVWNLTRPIRSQAGWVLAGVQQLS